jgi:phage tail-like protein
MTQASLTEQSARLASVALNLVPEDLEIPLRAVPVRPATESLWHRVETPPGILVSLHSGDDRARIIRLGVRSATPGWSGAWCRWSYTIRRAPDIQGGAALAAQDLLSDDAAVLTLLLMPGERRTATIEFVVALDGETAPGYYDVEIVGTDVEDGSVGIALGTLRLTHPESELLAPLPSIYADPPSRPRKPGQPYEDLPFFARFLLGFEDAADPLRTLVDHRERLFDLREAPSDFLPWLATWVSLVLDQNWPELKRRRLIREAVDLYRWRGTRRGLSRYLEIYTGTIPQIDDQPFQGMRLGPESLLGQGTILGGVAPHSFVVTLAVADPRTVNEQIVRDIVESEKPAHTAYDIRIVHRVD